MTGGKYVELLQIGDGFCLDQGVGVVLYDGIVYQIVYFGCGYSIIVICIRYIQYQIY